VIIHGGAANANKVITLKIAGVSTQTLTATSNAAGVASFTFTLSAAGVYTLTATNASGAVVSTQTITVHAVGAASVAPKLSSTGFEGTGLAVGGGLLVLTGAGAVLVARRRKTAQVPA
jgi:PKD repeat protein